MLMQSALRLIYPAECLLCRSLTETDFALCGPCWRETPFVDGLVCDLCGTPLPGEEAETPVHCDDCMSIARPWNRGRTAMVYRENGRRIVLGLKHGDRSDLARPAARWLARAARPLICEETILVPVPLHWSRLLRRRYNQSAFLAKSLAQYMNLEVWPDALVRQRRTQSLGGQTRDARFATLQDAIRPHPTRGPNLNGKEVLLIDDVMTSGASLAASCEAAYAAGACNVNVLTLARAAKDP